MPRQTETTTELQKIKNVALKFFAELDNPVRDPLYLNHVETKLREIVGAPEKRRYRP